MKSAFVSLGAGSYQVPLIEAARDAGFHVIAVDRNPLAPGFASADECIEESITRPALVRRRLAGGANPIKALASRSFGRAMIAGAALSNALGIEGPDLRAARFFQDKRRYKAALARAGVLVPGTHEWTSDAGRSRLFSAGSVVVRPPRGSGKLGVQVLHTPRQKEAILSRSPAELLVEDLVRGTEITVLGACHSGRYETLLITSKRVSKSEPLFAEILHRYPASIPLHVEQQARQIMQAVADAAGLRTSALVGEFIFDGEKIFLVEAAPETGGEFLADWLFPALTGRSYFRWFVELLTASSMPAVPARKGAGVIRYILPEDGHFAGLTWPADPLIVERRVLAAAGPVSRTRGNLDRLAAFCLHSPDATPEELTDRADQIAEHLDIRYEPENQNAAR